MNTVEKLEKLREKMRQAGVDAYIVPSTDPHMSEYVPDHWKVRAYLSGFTGSAGTFVLTQRESALWTDGRYFIQAENELDGTEISLMRQGVDGTPATEEWLGDVLPAGSTVAFNGKLCSETAKRRFAEFFKKKEIQIKLVDLITDDLWPDRPALPSAPAWVLPLEFSGKSARDKLEELRRSMGEQGANALFLSRLDSVAWALNLRGGDVENTPYTLAYFYLSQTDAAVYMKNSSLTGEVEEILLSEGIKCRSYEAASKELQALKNDGIIMLDPNETSAEFYEFFDHAAWTVKEAADPVIALKAIKNSTEQACSVASHIRDGVAMVRFQIALENRLAAGDSFTEWDVAEMVHEERAKQEKFLSNSFTAIPAYGANAAMMHYSPKKDTAAKVEPRGFLLLDSGGQYKDGTTDITRTYTVGELDYFARRYYTLVLLCHIRLAKSVFMYGSTGGTVDILARETVWAEGLDYRCGTGHGVSYVGNVHEGPQSLRMTNTVCLEPGMNITIEPGLYEEGNLGIRIENEYFIVEKSETEYGRFLGFETFTFCPIDTKPLLLSMMHGEEVEWLNQYHKDVYQKLSPYLTEAEKEWLLEKCAPMQKEG